MAASNKLILQVTFLNAGEGSTYKTMAFASNMTVADAHNLIAAKGNMKGVKEQYGLYVKPLEAGDVGVWMKMEDKLSEYNLSAKGGIVFKLLPQPLQVTHDGGQASIPVDTQATVVECIKQITRSLSLPDGEYILHKTSDKNAIPFDYDRPLADQIEGRAPITIKKKKGGLLRANARKSRVLTGTIPSSGTKIIHPVFGRPIAQVTQMGVHGGLPVVVSKCISYLEEEALQLEGIFRISGNQNEILDLKKRFDEGIDVNVREASSPHSVSGLLKLYLRELPEPLITFNLYDTFIALFDTVKDKAIRIQYLKVLVDALPLPNRLLINRLLPFLNKVIENEAINKMAIHNVATVVGPNLLRSDDETPLLLVQHTPAVNEISCDLLRNWKMIVEEGEYDFISVGTATYSYKAQSESELSFNIGDVIFVIKEDDETGWWEGEVRGEYGFFPINYVNIFLKLKRNAPGASAAAAAAAVSSSSSSSASIESSSSPPASQPDQELPKAEVVADSSSNDPPPSSSSSHHQEQPKQQPQAVMSEPAMQQVLTNAAQAIDERESRPSRGRGRGEGGGGGGMSKKQFLQELEDIRKLVAEQSNSRNELEATISGLSSEIKSLKQRLSEVQSSVSNQASASPSSSSSSGISAELSESLLNDIDALKSENSVLRTETEQLKKSYREVSSSLIESKSTIEDLQREVEESNEALKSTKGELKTAMALVRELTMNFARLKGSVEALQAASSSSSSSSSSVPPPSASPIPIASSSAGGGGGGAPGPRFPTPGSAPRAQPPSQASVAPPPDQRAMDDDGVVIEEAAHPPGRGKTPPASAKTVILNPSIPPSNPPPSLSSQSRRVLPAGRGARRLISAPPGPPSTPSDEV